MSQDPGLVKMSESKGAHMNEMKINNGESSSSSSCLAPSNGTSGIAQPQPISVPGPISASQPQKISEMKANEKQKGVKQQNPKDTEKGENVNIDIDPHRRKVLNIIAHRRMLLERMKLCRKATRDRLNLYANENGKDSPGIQTGTPGTTSVVTGTASAAAGANATSTVSASLGKKITSEESLISSRKRNFGSKTEEIQTYKDLCKYAMAHTAKKHSAKSGGPAPRATAISLRTGSSVGNKMKAAVATLKSNAGWVSDSSSSMSANNQINRTVNGGGVGSGGISPTNNSIGNSSQAIAMNVKSGTSITGAGNLPLHHQSIQTSNANGVPIAPPVPSSSNIMAGHGQPPPSMATHQIMNQNVKKMVPANTTSATVSASGKQVKKKSSSSGKKRSGKVARGSNSNITSSSEKQQLGSNLPLHHGIMQDKWGQTITAAGSTISVGTGANGSQYSSSHPPRILCPEAERLRGKRRELTVKLDNLMRKKYADDPILKSYTATGPIHPVNGRQTRVAMPSSSLDDNPYCSMKKSCWKSFITADSAVCMLPRRRKTQWDYVLEEMRWLATDFVEENKWKRASAKALSAAVMRHLKDVGVSKYSPPKQQHRNTSAPSSSSSKDKKDHDADDVKLADVHADTISDTESNEDMEMEDASDFETHDNSEQNARKPALEFVDPSEKDIENARSISATVSTFIEDHWDLTSSTKLGMPPSDGDEQYDSVYLRFNNTRGKINIGEIQMESYGTKKGTKESGLKDNSASPSSSDETVPMPIQLSYDEIEKQINMHMEAIRRLEPRLAESYQQFHTDMNISLKTIGLELHQNQMEMLQFAETLWKDDDDDIVKNSVISGLVINGPIASGKTFSTGTLFWRRKDKGPQLLLCPGESLIRWRHELRRFDGLNVQTIGPNGWLYNKRSKIATTDFNSCDLILCELSLVEHLINLIRRGKAVFITVIVDTRCSTMFPLQYRDNQDGAGLVSTKRKANSSQGGDFPISARIANEIYSGEWWNSIINDLLGPNTKCAILETSGVVEGHRYLSQDKNLPASKKERSDISSFKVAFLFHQIFHSNKQTFGRRAFWWAKKHHKKLSSGTMQSEIELSGGARGVLKHLIQILSYHPEIDEEDIEGIISSSIPKWSVLNCTLSSSQRKAYDRACAFVRGCLLQPDESSEEANNHLLLAKALLRLRRACFHSELDTLASTAQHSGKELQRKFNQPSIIDGRVQNRMSSSQPDAALAKSLLEKSSKLRHLLTILYKDCGFDVVSKHFLFDTKPTRVGRKRSENKKRKKVLILATLPEVLLLISSFLNAIGIAHELLLPPSGLPGSGLASADTAQNAISWAHCQQSIARFDHAHLNKDSLTAGYSLNVLVSSPITLGSASFGLSASNAEVVISVDEDWSGRCDIQTFSVLRKNRTRNMKKTGGRKYIKLIADSTCEQSFLTFEKRGRGKKTAHALPMMTSLLKSTCLDGYGTINSSSSIILGKNLLRFAHVPLYKVFCSDAFPRGALAGTPPSFLSRPGGESLQSRDSKDDADLANLSDRSPLLLDDLQGDPSYVETVGGKRNAHSFGASLCRIESLASIPSLIGDDPSTEDIFFSPIISKEISTTYFPACRDICSKRVQRYILLSKRSSRSTSPGPYSDDKEGNSKKQKITAAPAQVEKSEKGKDGTEDDSSPPEIHRPVQIGITGSKAEDIASSLIWYAHNNAERIDPLDKDPGDSEANEKSRVNAYVRSYSSIMHSCDGNQGCEGLVYFPPLFPGLLQARQSNDDMSTPMELPTFNTTVGNQIRPPIISHGKKRKSTSDGNVSTKKIRTNPQIPAPAPVFPIGVPSVTSSQVYSSQSLLASTDLSMVAMNETDFMDSTMDLFDGGDILPDLTITKEEEIDTTLQNDSVADTTTLKPELDEDFGLLGAGYLPPLEESFKSAKKLHGYNNSYSYWLDPFESVSSSLDSFDHDEEKFFIDSSSKGLKLGSIILQVKKTKKPVVNPMLRTVPSMLGSYPPSSIATQMSNGYFEYPPINQQALTQKKKKKGGANDKRNLGGHPSTFHNVGSMQVGDTMPIALMPKDLKPHNQGEFATTIESFAHQGYPSVLLHHHLEDIMDSGRNGDFDRVQLLSHGIFFPSKQNSLAAPQSSIRELLPNEATGDCARKEADTQRGSFCRDTLVSSDVDFGPFTVSVFPDSSIKDKGVSSSYRVGIRLPMGVKVPKSINIFSKNKDVWSKLEDDLLIEYATRLCFNWHAISQALTRKSRFSSCLDVETMTNPIRSAKQCKERWKVINTGMSGRMGGDGSSKEGGGTHADTDTEFTSEKILLDSQRLSNVKVKTTQCDNGEYRRHTIKRLQRLKKASLKKHHVKLTIPGYTGGSHTPTLQIVSSHPSHSQSVQAAIAHSAGPSGIVPPRAEMWPLQFLDLTEKQHQHVKKMRQASAAAAASSSSASSSAAQSSKTQSGQSSSRQQAHQSSHQSSVPNPRPSSRGQNHPVARPIASNVQGAAQVQQPQQAPVMTHSQPSQQMVKPGQGIGGKGPSAR